MYQKPPPVSLKQGNWDVPSALYSLGSVSKLVVSTVEAGEVPAVPSRSHAADEYIMISKGIERH